MRLYSLYNVNVYRMKLKIVEEEQILKRLEVGVSVKHYERVFLRITFHDICISSVYIGFLHTLYG